MSDVDRLDMAAGARELGRHGCIGGRQTLTSNRLACPSRLANEPSPPFCHFAVFTVAHRRTDIEQASRPNLVIPQRIYRSRWRLVDMASTSVTHRGNP